jgi:protein-disulfide isomerase
MGWGERGMIEMGCGREQRSANALAVLLLPSHTHTHSMHTHSRTQADSLRQTVADNKVVVYSKTTCPYCALWMGWGCAWPCRARVRAAR